MLSWLLQGCLALESMQGDIPQLNGCCWLAYPSGSLLTHVHTAACSQTCCVCISPDKKQHFLTALLSSRPVLTVNAGQACSTTPAVSYVQMSSNACLPTKLQRLLAT